MNWTLILCIAGGLAGMWIGRLARTRPTLNVWWEGFCTLAIAAIAFQAVRIVFHVDWFLGAFTILAYLTFLSGCVSDFAEAITKLEWYKRRQFRQQVEGVENWDRFHIESR